MQQNFFNFYERTYHFTKLLLEKTSNHHQFALYETENFGKAIIIDQKEFHFLQDLVAQDEMAAFVPLFSIPKAQGALVLDGIGFGLAQNLLRYPDLHVDMVAPDATLLNEVQAHFSPEHTPANHPNFSFVPGEWVEWASEIRDVAYETIIINRILREEELSVIERLLPILTEDGVLIIKIPNFRFAFKFLQVLLEKLSMFQVVMPFQVPLQLNETCGFVFASQRAHPLANLQLQTLEMFGEFEYYSADMHKAAFALPEYAKKALRGLTRN